MEPVIGAEAMFAIDEKVIAEGRQLAQLGKVTDGPISLSGRTPEIFITKNAGDIIALYEFNEQGVTYYIGIATNRAD